MSETRYLYEVINPSDPITFWATPVEARVIGGILLASLLFVKHAETGAPVPADGVERDSIKADREAIWLDAEKRESYAQAWGSFLIGSVSDRRLFDLAVSKMSADEAAAFRQNWHETKRTSMNDICSQAWKAAVDIRGWKAKEPEAAAG